MRRRASLRFRAALAFALFGALVSVLLSAGLLLSAQRLNLRLIDETLSAELDDYVARRLRNPASLPPATASLVGYWRSATGGVEPPSAIAGLPTGRHELTLAGVPHRVAVEDRGDTRYFLLFNEQRQRQREREFVFYLAVGVALMTLFAAGGGLWLARRVVAPVTALAEAVRGAAPDEGPLDLDAHLTRDEVGELARALHRYQIRLAEFIEREQAFAADVSHELRTPLAVISGAVEILEARENRPAAERERLRRIGRAARDMTDMTEALLLLAREENADDDDDNIAAVADVLRECIEKHRHLSGEKMTRLSVDIRAQPQLPVRPALLAIVIGNLIRNALAYTEQGEVNVRLEADRLVVADTGSGIPGAELGRVFQRHYKGEASRGSGIGLSLVKRICNRHGWEIRIDSEEGAGTTAQLVF